MGTVTRGHVKWFSDSKGYGFVVDEKDPATDIFVHYSVIDQEGFATAVSKV
jgi:CspA family cold shock protein